jgi:glucose dehydrogenase
MWMAALDPLARWVLVVGRRLLLIAGVSAWFIAPMMERSRADAVVCFVLVALITLVLALRR